MSAWAPSTFSASTRGLTILSKDFLSGRRLRTATLAADLRIADLTIAAACPTDRKSNRSQSLRETQARSLQVASPKGT
jgi:hypothetical protein